jgi:hypothetical protein
MLAELWCDTHTQLANQHSSMLAEVKHMFALGKAVLQLFDLLSGNAGEQSQRPDHGASEAATAARAALSGIQSGGRWGMEALEGSLSLLESHFKYNGSCQSLLEELNKEPGDSNLHEAAENGRRTILDCQETSTPPLLGELCTAAECFHNMQQQLEKIEYGTPEEKSAAEACIIKTKESANEQLELCRSRDPDVAWASDLCGKLGHRVHTFEVRKMDAGFVNILNTACDACSDTGLNPVSVGVTLAGVQTTLEEALGRVEKHAFKTDNGKILKEEVTRTVDLCHAVTPPGDPDLINQTKERAEKYNAEGNKKEHLYWLSQFQLHLHFALTAKAEASHSAAMRASAAAKKAEEGAFGGSIFTAEPATAPKPPAAAPAADSADSGPSSTLEELQAGVPDGVDHLKKETFLSDADFQTHFGMDKAAFTQLPGWKRTAAKKKLRLH